MEGKYEFLESIGKGKFGTVLKAKDLTNDTIVAVKKITYKNVNDGVPISVTREFKILKALKHNNIVRLLNVYPTDKEMCLVFELMDCDLHTFMEIPEFATPRGDPHVIKNFMRQILSATAFCQSQKILHRDLKPRNILVDCTNMVVKLADFGLSREVSTDGGPYTSMVATLPYMAPEVLFGYPHYSFPMDIWAVGCIFGKMVVGRTLFDGHDLIHQIQKIFSVMGTPNEETWPGIRKIFPYIDRFEKYIPKNMANEILNLEPAGIDLLTKLLRMDPSKRITAEDALNHPYFSNP